MRRLYALLAALAPATSALGQLPPPPAPAGNPVTPEKAQLGKALFWDEQLSSSGTVSCGTCHMPEAGGSDPRTLDALLPSWHPGPDGVFGTGDDARGSRGVPLARADGSYLGSTAFGLGPQVTSRKAPSAIGSGYSRHLFWDGRAGSRFSDPLTGQLVLGDHAALESQALAPIVSPIEMGHVGRSWSAVAERLEEVTPLGLSGQVPAELETWIAGRSYPQLFGEVFGDPAITPVRLAMAIATYERTLVPDQTPWDQVLAGVPPEQVLTDEERFGLLVFLDPDTGSCGSCHSDGQGPTRFTDDRFHYIGVRPQGEDPGRGGVTGLAADEGAMRTPDLRNVELRAPYMHDGSLETLSEVIQFYQRGGDFDGSNLHPDIRPLAMTPRSRRDLAAFLGRPLTDPRVAAGLPPFDRPSQYADSVQVPQVYGEGTSGSGGAVPEIVALEPPKLGLGSLTVGVERALGGAPALLLVSSGEVAGGVLRQGARLYPDASSGTLVPLTALEGAGAAGGFGSLVLRVPSNPALAGAALHLQWIVRDPGAAGGLAASRPARWTWF